MENCKIGFIGCGNIAGAIISGILNSGYIKPENLCVFDTDNAKMKAFSDRGATSFDSVTSITSFCDYIFLTVKPQVYDVVLEEIRSVSKGKCFVAVAAGITIGHIKSVLGFDAPVIRVMPNTPLMYGEGASALVKASPVNDEQFAFIKGIFSCSGLALEVNESEINTVTAISGSAPAYVMRFARDFIDFAVSNGMEKETAKALVLQAIRGSAEMISRSPESIGTLIKNVTSPNGTTEAGLKSLDESDFEEVINKCLSATEYRAEELTK